jgi:IclR family pca regulon transcriptional regulator
MRFLSEKRSAAKDRVRRRAADGGRPRAGKPVKARTIRGKKPHTSATLAKGLRIWALFSEEEPQIGLAEIARRTGINKTSALRYLAAFCEAGYLEKDAATRFYRIGVRTMAMAYGFLQRAEIVQRVKPLVDEVHKRHDLHVDVGLLQGDAIHLVYRRESKDTLAFRHFTTGPGLHYLATGKAAMAQWEPRELRARLARIRLERRTERTITDKGRLLAELAETRRRGFALNDEEFVPGLVAIGAPLFNRHTGRVVGGVSFDASTTRFSIGELAARHAALLVELSKELSAAIS